MRHVGMLEAKTHLSSLVAEVEGGDTVVLTRNGRPVAKLSAIGAQPRKRKVSGLELAERLQRLHEEIARDDPGPFETWEELKEIARR